MYTVNRMRKLACTLLLLLCASAGKTRNDGVKGKQTLFLFVSFVEEGQRRSGTTTEGEVHDHTIVARGVSG